MLRSFTRHFNQHSLSGKYATALYNAGETAKQSSAVKKDILDLHSKLLSDSAARAVLEDPTIAIKVKLDWFDGIADKYKYNKVTKSFLKLVAENKREVLLEKILAEYVSFVQHKDGIVNVKVSSTQKLSQKELDQVKSKMAKITKGSIVIENCVNPDILGGLVIEFGDYLIDLSVTDKINQVKSVILAQ